MDGFPIVGKLIYSGGKLQFNLKNRLYWDNKIEVGGEVVTRKSVIGGGV